MSVRTEFKRWLFLIHIKLLNYTFTFLIVLQTVVFHEHSGLKHGTFMIIFSAVVFHEHSGLKHGTFMIIFSGPRVHAQLS